MRCPYCGENIGPGTVHYCDCKPLGIKVDLIKLWRWLQNGWWKKEEGKGQEAKKGNGAGCDREEKEEINKVQP